MVWLVYIGAVITVAGLAGILYSLLAVSRARRAGLTDEALRARLAGLVPINIGALAFAMLGLMVVIVGVILA